jgi:plastocyanin
MRLRIALLTLACLAFAGAAQAALVQIQVGPSNSFTPKFPTIDVGDTVRWTNMGGFHNVSADDGTFRNGDPSNTQWTFERTFNSPGTVGYHCEAHGSPGGGMFGTITVTGGGGGAAGTIAITGSANRSVGEGAGNITFTLSRTGGDDGAVSVTFETVNNGTASFPSDYIQTNEPISWADNDDNNKTINVPIVDDSDDEPNETFSVHIVDPTGGAQLGQATVNVTITDNDDVDPGNPGTIRFASATPSPVSEGAATVSLTVRRVDGTAGAVSAAFDTANGSATSGSDFNGGPGVVAWADGDGANKFINIPIVADTVEEPTESFTVTLSAPTGGATIGTPATATVTINDDDLTCVPCVSDATTLCLAGGSGDPNRFRVKVRWTDFEGHSGDGMAVPYTPDSGFFWFFTSDNLEYLTKMVNGCGSFADAYWFYYAAATNLQLETEVLDTTACVVRTYSNPLGNFASDGDINALPTCGTASSPAGSAASPPGIEAAAPLAAVELSRPAPVATAGAPVVAPLGGGCPPCVSDATTLCLAGGSGDPGRFEVKVRWTDFEAHSGDGMAVPYTPDSGFFWFFTADNLEYLTKMVNGCGSFADAYWFYYAAATNLQLSTTVRDTIACQTRTYDNPLGNFASDGDINALPTCAANASVQE